MPDTPERWLDQQRINAHTPGRQADPALTQLASGNILHVWTDFDDGGEGGEAGADLIGRLYDPLGEPVSSGNFPVGEFQINSLETLGDERDAQVTALADGGFMAVYETEDGDDRDIVYEVFDSSASQLRNGRIANDTNSDLGYRDAAVASQAADNALAAYVVDRDDGSEDIEIRSLDPATGSVGSATTLFDGPTGAGEDVAPPEVAALSNGDYAVVFADRNAGEDDDVALFLRNADGSSDQSQTVASNLSGDDDEHTDVQIAALAGGGFAVAWTYDASGGTNSGIRARVYDNDGTPRGGIFTPHTTGAGNQNEPTVTALADGGFVIGWDDDQDEAVRGQRFDASGNAVGDEFDIDTFGHQQDPAFQGLGDGRFATAFTQDDPGASTPTATISIARSGTLATTPTTRPSTRPPPSRSAPPRPTSSRSPATRGTGTMATTS